MTSVSRRSIVPLVAVDDLQSSSAVFGFENLVALRFQILAGEAAEIGFIFDEKDGFLSTIGARKAERILRGGGVFPAVDSRKIGAESGAALRLAIDKNKAAALFHDAVHGGEAEAGALGALGGEERLEDARLGIDCPCRCRCR